MSPTEPKRNPWLWPLIITLLISALLLWRWYSVSSLKAEHAEKEAQLTARANAMVDSLRTDDILRGARLLSWAVRSEMVRDNMEQVGQYLLAYLKEPGVQRISLVAPDGTIRICTDRKLEGTRVALPAASDQGSIAHADARSTAYAPVLGVDQLLGVVMVEADRPSLTPAFPTNQDTTQAAQH